MHLVHIYLSTLISLIPSLLKFYLPTSYYPHIYTCLICFLYKIYYKHVIIIPYNIKLEYHYFLSSSARGKRVHCFNFFCVSACFWDCHILSTPQSGSIEDMYVLILHLTFIKSYSLLHYSFIWYFLPFNSSLYNCFSLHSLSSLFLASKSLPWYYNDRYSNTKHSSM